MKPAIPLTLLRSIPAAAHAQSSAPRHFRTGGLAGVAAGMVTPRVFDEDSTTGTRAVVGPPRIVGTGPVGNVGLR